MAAEIQEIIEIDNDERGLYAILQRLAILGSRRRSLSDSNALIVVKSHITPSSELSISILT